jgi:hypothetical protein
MRQRMSGTRPAAILTAIPRPVRAKAPGARDEKTVERNTRSGRSVTSGALVRRAVAFAVVLGLISIAPSFARTAAPRKDEVLDWNAVLRTAVVSPLNVPPIPVPAQMRICAIVHAAMFDALNGIEPRYAPIYVAPDAERGSARRAAVVQAAYTTLTALVPSESSRYDQQLAASLAAITASGISTQAIERGRAWGLRVANEILALRAGDGLYPLDPPYMGSATTGKWRPTPPTMAPALLPSLARTQTFVIPSPSSHRPDAPPALTSATYTADFDEVKAIGDAASTVRTADQTQSARFFAGTAETFWNRVAVTAAVRRRTTLAENARIFALLNMAMADAIISCWDAKYTYELWRPVTAIRLASTDGNSDTAENATWTPLVPTPPYPENASGHSAISGAAQAVLTSFFGNQLVVEGTSEGLPGVQRRWPNFSAAADEANLSRIWAGIHFRTAVVEGRATGDAIGLYVVANAAQPLQDKQVARTGH